MISSRISFVLLRGPHKGSIDVVLADKENGLVVSGGDDGRM